MKKILLFTDSLGAGGAQRQLVGLAVLLSRKGYLVKVCTYHNVDFYKSFLDSNNVPNELIPNSSSKKKRFFSVVNYFKKENPDWVIAYQETPSLLACIAKVFGGNFRLIVSERNTTQSIGLSERLRFFLYKKSDSIVPNSYAQEKFLKTRYSWMQNKLQTISNFVDLEYFNFEPRIKKDIPECVIAASIWSSKNTLGFIEAVKKLADRGYKIHFSWYGKNSTNVVYYKLCQQKIEDLNLQDFIELKDKTKDIKTVYQEADFFCLPSFYEGTPNVICEAMSCGRPVLCSDVCDNSKYVSEGVNGFLFDPYLPETISNSFEKALKVTNDEYAMLCINSRKRAEELLSEKVFVDKYIKIIENSK